VPKKSDGDGKFTLRPHRPPIGGKREAIAWSTALRTVFRYASSSRRRPSASQSSGSGLRRPRNFNQRCAVRITYVKNKIAGQWKAHGRYISREGAAHGNSVVFNQDGNAVEPAQALDGWQKAGDARLWKFIVSPEFGERVDLQKVTRELMQRMEADLGTGLEWVAVTHFNTEHAHTHIAVRGRREDGSVLDIPREYVKAGVRAIAEDLCTRQLGYRTELDAREAERREVNQARVTSLDRLIDRANHGEAAEASKYRFNFRVKTNETKRDQMHHIETRLAFLQKLGLAAPLEPHNWSVRVDFLTVLKTMQQTADRQRTLAAHQALLSDPRLPVVVTEQRNIKKLEGRVLGHGEDDGGKIVGRHYMLLEGTDAKIHLIYYTPELEEARSRSQLAVNSFVKLEKRFQNGRPFLNAQSLGDAESLLDDKTYFRKAALQCRPDREPGMDQVWGGWLGRYRAELGFALERTAADKVGGHEY
jgi:hypothetical protein